MDPLSLVLALVTCLGIIWLVTWMRVKKETASDIAEIEECLNNCRHAAEDVRSEIRSLSTDLDAKNAQIASLLEACKALLWYVKQHPSRGAGAPHLNETIEEAEVVIAKAEGREVPNANR